jgi:hypothetical protein
VIEIGHFLLAPWSLIVATSYLVPQFFLTTDPNSDERVVTITSQGTDGLDSAPNAVNMRMHAYGRSREHCATRIHCLQVHDTAKSLIRHQRKVNRADAQLEIIAVFL